MDEFASSHKLDAFIISHGDEHNSEYLSPSEERLKLLTGFSGSNGTGLWMVHLKQGFVWTDGRYFVQAGKELFPNWNLKKMGEDETIEEYLRNHHHREGAGGGEDGGGFCLKATSKRAKKMFRIGIYSRTCSMAFYRKLLDSFNAAPTVELVLLDEDLCKNKLPKRERDHESLTDLQSFYGKSHQSLCKINKVRDCLRTFRCDSLLVSTLDDIAWVLNMRGEDIKYNPLFFAYLYVSQTSVVLFTNHGLIESSLLAAVPFLLIRPYEEVFDFFSSKKKPNESGETIWIDVNALNCKLYLTLNQTKFTKLEQPTNPIKQMKPVKCAEEIKGMKHAQLLDALAFVSFLHNLATMREPCWLNEFECAQLLERERKQVAGDKYLYPSFATISSFDSNGAVIHYHPKSREESMSVEKQRGCVYLCDAGGHFEFGTTDTTRTIWIGPNHHQTEKFEKVKKYYTLVLKAHIALATTKFPRGTLPHKLDSITRRALWEEGANYNHGTGHGIGTRACVHELPPLIGQSPGNAHPLDLGLVEGVIVTDEPGYYEDGEFGIRIESALLVKQSSVGEKFCEFEYLTPVPFHLPLIDVAKLTKQEIDFVNNHHAFCVEMLSERISDQNVKHWLVQATQKI